MSRTRYGLALASAATLASLSCGTLVSAAAADPGGVPNQGNNGKHVGQVKHGDDGKKHGNGKGHGNGNGKGHGQGHGQGQGGHGHGQGGQAHGQGHANGHAHAPGQQADHSNNGKGNNGNQGNGNQGNGNQGSGEHGDPPGNNGTVKIAAPSDAIGHPSNNPHPGCTVVVEWFGFDAGDDVVSTLSFAPHAPTSDVTIGGTSPSSVFVGGDAASGGTDLDGRQAYTLTFTGEPHPKQGYHVKLTVSTPRSLGNDTKSKVFWVEPCASTPFEGTPDTPETGTPETGTPGTSTPGTTNGAPPPNTALSAPPGASSQSFSASGSTTTEERSGSDGDALVPTAVDAGEDASALPEWARSPLPLTAVAGGLVLVAAGLARRARNGG